MNIPEIKCYNPNVPGGTLDIFVLSKGLNAGKPLWVPCPNCFTITAASVKDQNLYYWILYGLWQGGFFRHLLVGSVIPFLRITDLKLALVSGKQKAEANFMLFESNLEKMKLLEQQLENIRKQKDLIYQAKRALMFQVLK